MKKYMVFLLLIGLVFSGDLAWGVEKKEMVVHYPCNSMDALDFIEIVDGQIDVSECPAYIGFRGLLQDPRIRYRLVNDKGVLIYEQTGAALFLKSPFPFSVGLYHVKAVLPYGLKMDWEIYIGK